MNFAIGPLEIYGRRPLQNFSEKTFKKLIKTKVLWSLRGSLEPPTQPPPPRLRRSIAEKFGIVLQFRVQANKLQFHASLLALLLSRYYIY